MTIEIQTICEVKKIYREEIQFQLTVSKLYRCVMALVGDMNDAFLQSYEQEMSQPENIAQDVQEPITVTLQRLDQNLTSVRSSLEKKRSKVILADVNRKLDQILEILTSRNA